MMLQQLWLFAMPRHNSGPIKSQSGARDRLMGSHSSSLLNYCLLVDPEEGQSLSAVVYPLSAHLAPADVPSPIAVQMTLAKLRGSCNNNRVMNMRRTSAGDDRGEGEWTERRRGYSNQHAHHTRMKLSLMNSVDFIQSF